MNEATPPEGSIDRRTFLILLGVVAASPSVSCGGRDPNDTSPETTGSVTADAKRWFTADSFWNKALPDDAPQDPRSAEFLGWLDEHTNGFLLSGLGENRWGMPCFIAGESDPAWEVSLTNTAPQVRPIMEDGLRAPDRALTALTGTSDSPIVILDPARGVQVALWQTSADASGFQAVDAAIYWHDSNGLAAGDENRDGDPRNHGHRGIAPSTMLVQRPEIGQGIDHVLKVAIPGTAEWHVRPMVGHEPDRGGVIGQGMRLRIRADVDLEQHDLSEPALTIARALQRYGAIVGDNSGADRIVLKVEQDLGQWSGVDLEADSLATIPVDDLAFVRAGWEPQG
jgi:hypothetical protein